MTIIYRNQKGIPLTSDEIDGNFKELADRIEDLEKNPPIGEGISKINKINDELEIIGTQGTILGRFKLSNFSYTPQGYWQPDTAYYVHDLVTLEEKVWICINTHRSLAQFEEKNWKIFLDASRLFSH